MAPRALVGLPPTPQRDSIVSGLQADGFEVSLAPDRLPHQAVESALSPGAPDVIVTHAGGDDAALLAALSTLKANGVSSATLVVLGEAGTAPGAFLDAGAACVLRTTDSYDAVAEAIASHFYGGTREGARVPVIVTAVLRVGGKAVSGVTQDVSTSGAAVMVPAKDLPHPPAVGDRVDLELVLSNLRMQCPARVRRLSAHRTLFTRRLTIGVEFEALPAEAERAVRELIDRTQAGAAARWPAFHRPG
jgi:hypothetical protein